MRLNNKTIHSAFVFMALALPCFAADLPQFGERFTRNQIANETGLPSKVDPVTGEGIKWTSKLGSQSYATPVIAQGKVFVGTNNESPRDPRHKGDRGIIYCLDEKTGKMIWQSVVPKIGDAAQDWPGAGIAAPVTVEGGRVYALNNRVDLMCLDINGMANGNDGPFKDEAKYQSPATGEQVPVGPTDADIIWVADLQALVNIQRHDTGYGNPLIVGDFLYINSNNGVDGQHTRVPQPNAPSLLVFDKKTGRLVGKDAENIGQRLFHNTYSSPSYGVVKGRPQICFGGGDGVVYAFEPLTKMPPEGTVVDLKRIWKYDPDPTSPKVNVNKYRSNRKVSPSNFLTPVVFVGDRLYLTVGGDIWWGKFEAWLKCVDAEKGTEIWSYSMKHSCSIPAVVGPLTFVADTGNKTINCVDTATGKELWTHPLEGDIWSSPFVADGKLYIGTRKNKFYIFAAAKEKNLLCETTLDAPITATLSAANGVLYVATHKTLYALSAGARSMPTGVR